MYLCNTIADSARKGWSGARFAVCISWCTRSPSFAKYLSSKSLILAALAIYQSVSGVVSASRAHPYLR